MTQATQGDRCKSCNGPCTMDDFVVIRENATEGRVHIQTCVGCVCQLNNLESK